MTDFAARGESATTTTTTISPAVSGQQQQQQHYHLTTSHQPSEADARSFMQSTQGASQTFHTSLSAAQSGPGFIPTIRSANTTASTTDLADGLQMASLATPTTISPLYIDDRAAAAVTALSSSHGQPMQPMQSSTATIYMQGLSGTTSLAQQAAPNMAPTHTTSISGAATPSLRPDSQMTTQQIDMAATAAFVAQMNAQSLQQQQYMDMSSEQTSVSMMQPMASSLPATGAPVSSLPSQMGALNLPAGSPTNSGLGIMSTLPLTAPLAVSGLQPAMITQQQAAYAAAMGGVDPMYSAGAQFGASMSQPADHQYLGMTNGAHMMAMSHAHSRTASTVDGGVATYSNDDSNSVTPRSGFVSGVPNMGVHQPITTQLQQQLQQHQQQQLQQQQQQQHQQSQGPLPKGLSANASTVASTNQSGAPSPFANTPLPMANQGNSAAPIGHRRQQSSSFLTTLQQHQPQQAMYVDPPMALATAPPTLVPGTPTPFGQLQFHLHAPGTATAPHPLNHPHASHFGHSRHLSLDAANFRLMAADTPSMGGFPAHTTIHEHPVELSQHAAHFASVQQQQQIQQLQQQQLQQQLHRLQQLQAQQ
ncbi:hypothetical protein GGI16_004940, partial [Coemansia sp. S142-1]